MNARIEKLDHLFLFLKENSLQTRKRFFRGQSSVSYDLLPSIGRFRQAEINTLFDISDERRMLNSFRQKGYPYLTNEFSEIELLTIAQHHGLPTRLLDWTWNPLVATFFSVWNDNNFDEDGVIYYSEREGFEYKRYDSIEPFDIKEMVIYEPKHINSRITAQSGFFSIQPKPYEPVIDERIKKVIIAKEIKEEIGISLETMGIHYGNLFPGLDGVSNYIRWLYTY